MKFCVQALERVNQYRIIIIHAKNCVKNAERQAFKNVVFQLIQFEGSFFIRSSELFFMVFYGFISVFRSIKNSSFSRRDVEVKWLILPSIVGFVGCDDFWKLSQKIQLYEDCKETNFLNANVVVKI